MHDHYGLNAKVTAWILLLTIKTCLATATSLYSYVPDAMPAMAVCPIQRPGTNSAEPEGTAAADTTAANM